MVVNVDDLVAENLLNRLEPLVRNVMLRCGAIYLFIEGLQLACPGRAFVTQNRGHVGVHSNPFAGEPGVTIARAYLLKEIGEGLGIIPG